MKMDVNLVLQDTETGKYYAGCGYNIRLSSDIDDAELFDDMDAVRIVVDDEYLNEMFEEKQFKIIQVLTGNKYNE